MQYDTFKAICESTRVKPQMDSTGYGSQLMLVYWEILSEGNKRGGPVPISCTKLKKKIGASSQVYFKNYFAHQ